jgi:protein-S-isoprenylcysteine O-methyltransferase Ste14
MYVGLMFLFPGWALVAGSPLLGGYAVFFAIASLARRPVRRTASEGAVRRTLTAYANAVPRWLPRFPGKK